MTINSIVVELVTINSIAAELVTTNSIVLEQVTTNATVVTNNEFIYYFDNLVISASVFTNFEMMLT